MATCNCMGGPNCCKYRNPIAACAKSFADVFARSTGHHLSQDSLKKFIESLERRYIKNDTEKG